MKRHSSQPAPVYATQPPNMRYSHSHSTSSAFSASANPNEDWTKISDLAERRRIQNRIAQRNYRKKLKRRLEDLERRASSDSTSPEPKPAQLSPPISIHGDASASSHHLFPTARSPEPFSTSDLHGQSSRLSYDLDVRNLSHSPAPTFSSYGGGSDTSLPRDGSYPGSPAFPAYGMPLYGSTLSPPVPIQPPRHSNTMPSSIKAEDEYAWSSQGLGMYAHLTPQPSPLSAQQQRQQQQFQQPHSLHQQQPAPAAWHPESYPNTPPLSDTHESSPFDDDCFGEASPDLWPAGPPTPGQVEESPPFFFL